MSKQPSLPFEGSLLDATGYHMSIIDTSAIYRAILNNKRALEEEYRIAWDETEELYAWCVVQAISDAFREHRVLGHYHNSLYMEVLSWTKLLRDAEMRNKIFFNKLGID